MVAITKATIGTVGMGITEGMMPITTTTLIIKHKAIMTIMATGVEAMAMLTTSLIAEVAPTVADKPFTVFVPIGN
jgi:hypothetical protein